ncbi:MAG TPA: hypothetical protein VML75_01690 [Kofleriaceae bacterium]|nr:hypothetical protein [Kofleriaceae bacterium]
MTRILLALSLTAFLGACGGGSKNEATTPNPCEANPCEANPCNPCAGETGGDVSGDGDMPADDDDYNGEDDGDGAVEDDM